MKNVKFIFVLFGMFVGGICEAQDKPNILLIYADDLAPLLGCYGHTQVKSPEIDAFAKEAVLFEEVHCQVAICTASRTSILTGVRPSTSGLYGLNHDFKRTLPGNISMPKHFSNHGYKTIAMGKIADPRGGDWSDQWDDFHRGSRIESSIATDKLKQLATESKPWFLAVGFSEPHCPWNPSTESRALYNVSEIELQGPGRSRPTDYRRDCYGENKSVISDYEAQETTMRYYATVTDLDKKVGAVLQAARDLGMFSNTIIVFWSGDHGFHLGENYHWGKWENYRASTWVPLIMRVPGRGKPGARVTGLVETIDMYQTLMDLTGLPDPDCELEGYSFAPLLDKPDQPWKIAVFSHDISGERRAVKTKRYDYIKDENGDNKELFDMIKDPKETTNIAKNNSDIIKRMEEVYSAGWEKAIPVISVN